MLRYAVCQLEMSVAAQVRLKQYAIVLFRMQIQNNAVRSGQWVIQVDVGLQDTVLLLRGTDEVQGGRCDKIRLETDHLFTVCFLVGSS